MPNPAQILAQLKSQNPQGYDPSELELATLAHRDPNSVKPGSNEYWQSELDSSRKDHDILHAAELSKVLAVDKANTDASIAGFTGNPTYKSGPNSYESHDPSLDTLGPTPMAPSHRPTMTPSGQAAQFGRSMDTAKVNSPVNVANIQAGQKASELAALQSMLGGNALPGGMHINLGNGIGASQEQPRMQPVNNKASDALAKALEARKNLDNGDPSDSIENFFAGHGVPGLATTETRKANLDKQIASLQAEMQNPAVASHQQGPAPSSGNSNELRNRAIQELTNAGYVVNEASIQHIMRQLGGQ